MIRLINHTELTHKARNNSCQWHTSRLAGNTRLGLESIPRGEHGV